MKLAECRGLAPHARRRALISNKTRLACPVDIPNWSARGDLHSQGCSILNRTGLLFPVNHAPVGDPRVALPPWRDSAILSRRGLLIPAEASRREMVGMKGLAPPRLPDSESGPSAIRVKPHALKLAIEECKLQNEFFHSAFPNLQSAFKKLAHPAGLSPANSPFEAEHDYSFTTDAEMVAADGNAPSEPRL